MKQRMANQKQMENNLQQYLQHIEASVQAIQFPENPKTLYEPMSYILRLGGKRMRPVLTLMACDAFGADFKTATNAALAVELFHNFSLIHDDIMDKAPLRRGEQTVHMKWNENVAILSGDAMLIEAYKLLSTYNAEKSHALIKTFNITSTEVCEGQQLDMDFERSTAVSIPEYLDMIRLKTAVLLGCSLQMGSILANASAENQTDIYNFGVNLGIAFQLQDDILDLYADQAKFGKQVGGDILSNKKTYLILKAFEDASADQRKHLDALLLQKENPEKIEQAKVLFAALDIKEKATVKMEEFYTIAMQSLAHLQIAESQKKSFRELAAFLMGREN